MVKQFELSLVKAGPQRDQDVTGLLSLLFLYRVKISVVCLIWLVLLLRSISYLYLASVLIKKNILLYIIHFKRLFF